MSITVRFTQVIVNRDVLIKFADDSTINRDRIMYINWYLTDRYSEDSMNYEKRGQDNLQSWLNQDKDAEISAKINSNEDHILTQEVHWDDGFEEIVFTREYTITTQSSTINPTFSYEQIYVTGPEIRFHNTTTVNDYAVQLGYELLLSDTTNEGLDATTEYIDIGVLETQDHVYKSVSNSPFEIDDANKLVKMTVWYDNGWDETYDIYSAYIIVKPNRINQDFLTNPIRHPADTETSDFIITGNNPIEFHDNSDTQRIDDFNNKDFSFIKNVKYTVTDDCGN